MKLSMSLIANYLRSYQPECHILHDTLSIKGVRFLDAPLTSFSLDYIYLGNAEGYYQDPRYRDALLLANGENQILCRCADREELLNEVLSAFDFYGEFEQKLFLASAQNRPLQEMAEVVSSVLECGILIFDMDAYLLCGVLPENMKMRTDLKNTFLQKRLDLEGIGSVIVEENGKISHDLSDEPKYMNIKNTDHPGCVAMYLSRDDQRIGFLMLFLNDVSQVSVCMNLAPTLAQCAVNAAEFTNKSSLRQSSNSVFLSLLAGEPLPPAVREKFVSDLHLGSNAVLMVFQSISIRNYTFHKMLLREIRDLDTPCIASEYEGHLCILTSDQASDAVIRFLSSRIPASSMALGISMQLQDLTRLPVALSQALFALNASDGPGIRRCRDLALPYLLQTLREQEMSMHLLHPALELLDNYDRANHTELFHTLDVYTQTGCSQIDAANILHVHLNTLKYRLNRIRELTQANLKDQDELFYILLSFRLARSLL